MTCQIQNTLLHQVAWECGYGVGAVRGAGETYTSGWLVSSPTRALTAVCRGWYPTASSSIKNGVRTDSCSAGIYFTMILFYHDRAKESTSFQSPSLQFSKIKNSSGLKLRGIELTTALLSEREEHMVTRVHTVWQSQCRISLDSNDSPSWMTRVWKSGYLDRLLPQKHRELPTF